MQFYLIGFPYFFQRKFEKKKQRSQTIRVEKYFFNFYKFLVEINLYTKNKNIFYIIEFLNMKFLNLVIDKLNFSHVRFSNVPNDKLL